MNSLLMTILAPLVLLATLCAGKAVMCVTRHDRQPSLIAPTRIVCVQRDRQVAPHRAEWN